MFRKARDREQIARLAGTSNLVIAAHPDDEVFWAGLTLAGGEWSAAVLTHRSTNWRREAFEKAMTTLDIPGAIFDLDDTHGRSQTAAELDALRTLLTRLVSLPHLTDVMTHSPDGETGHAFHKLVSEIVTEVVPTSVRLHYFSFSRDRSPVLDEAERLAKKRAVIDTYLAAMPGDIGNDALHIQLSAFEAPVLAAEYVRPAELLRSVYAGSTVPNADIPDAITPA
jgi:LmbE family N-acetylglucosaminyl deacetylase